MKFTTKMSAEDSETLRKSSELSLQTILELIDPRENQQSISSTAKYELDMILRNALENISRVARPWQALAALKEKFLHLMAATQEMQTDGREKVFAGMRSSDCGLESSENVL